MQTVQQDLAEIVKARGVVATCPLLEQENFMVQDTEK
jgi:hypothetical protein